MKPKNRKPSFFWQGVLILAPVLVLAKVGALAIWQDKRTARQQAEARAQELAEANAKAISQALLTDDHWQAINARNSNVLAVLWDNFAANRFGQAPFGNLPTPDRSPVVVDMQGELRMPTLYEPVPEPAPFDLRELTPAQSNLWVSAQGARDGRSAIESFNELLVTPLPTRLRLNAKLALAALLEKENETIAANALWQELATHSTSALTESGIEVSAAALTPLIRSSTNFAFFVGSNAVHRPSPITANILEEIVARENTGTNRQPGTIGAGWLSVWGGTELGRMLYHAARPLFRTNQVLALTPALSNGVAVSTTLTNSNMRVTPPNLFWTKPLPAAATNYCGFYVFNTGEPALAARLDVPGGYQLACLSRMQAVSLAEKSIMSADGIDFTVKVGEIELRGTNQLMARALQPAGKGGGQTLQRIAPWNPERLTVVQHLIDDTPIIVSAYFVAPHVFFGQQEERARWFGLLIGASMLASLIGFVSAYRAFHKQLRLAEMKSNFVSSVSHELRAPIASVRLMAEGLERGKISDPAKQKEYFRFITQECRRLSSMIENVLDFARIEQGRKQYEFEPTDVSALVEQTVRVMEPYAAERGVTLVNVPPASCRVRTADSPGSPDLSSDRGLYEVRTRQDAGGTLTATIDGQAMQQALVNLIDNAIKHSPRDNEVKVALALDNSSTLQLSVEDQGCGIPAAEHEKIFERFYRLGSELRRETPGVGIGLSIVKHVVEAHGGRVRVESDVGKGSRFTIELPMKVPPASCREETDQDFALLATTSDRGTSTDPTRRDAGGTL